MREIIQAAASLSERRKTLEPKTENPHIVPDAMLDDSLFSDNEALLQYELDADQDAFILKNEDVPFLDTSIEEKNEQSNQHEFHEKDPCGYIDARNSPFSTRWLDATSLMSATLTH